MSAIIPISYFNSFWLKKTGSLVSKNTDDPQNPKTPKTWIKYYYKVVKLKFIQIFAIIIK